MYPFGHMAAGCGTAWLARRAALNQQPGNFLTRSFQRIDYRAVAFGSLLPDLIDKPLVWFVIRNEEYGGHHVGHSLLFSLGLSVAGLALAKRGSTALLMVAFGTLTHVLYDSVTHVPWSLCYPFVELDVPRNGLLLRTTNLAGELLGLAALAFYLGRPARNTRVARFVLDGDIEV